MIISVFPKGEKEKSAEVMVTLIPGATNNETQFSQCKYTVKDMKNRIHIFPHCAQLFEIFIHISRVIGKHTAHNNNTLITNEL